MDRDRAAFEALVDEHGTATLALLRRLCRDPHDADDLFREVAVRAWRHLGSRPRLRNPRGWLMTIAYRAHLDDQARRPCHVRLLDHAEVAGRSRDPAATAELLEQVRSVAAAVEGLSPALREVIALHYTGGLSLRQVAGAMGLSVGTVESRLNAGREQLRRRLP